MHKPRNPVARSPLMRKGGPHQRSPSAIRAGQRKDIRAALETHGDRTAKGAPNRAARGDPDSTSD